jgi:hypothetical protein
MAGAPSGKAERISPQFRQVSKPAVTGKDSASQVGFERSTRVETGNDQLVALRGSRIIVMAPKQEMTQEEALRHAAWLVAIASEGDGDFERILAAVQNT